MKHEHPAFAWFYEAMNKPAEWFGASGMNRMRTRLVSRLDGRILEVGAGNGLNFSHYTEAAEIVGLEPDPHMLRRAMPRAEAAKARIFLLGADGEELPFGAETFDRVVSCLMLCTVPDPERALSEMRRVLRPDGEFHFIEHVRARPRWLASIQNAVDPAWTRISAGCHLNRDTQATIEHAGFRVEKMSEGVAGVMIRGRAVAR